MPARKRAAELRELASVALWIERRGAVLFAQRPEGGLYGGLWELPQGDDAAAAARAIGVELRGATHALGEHKQVLSHRRLRIALARAIVVGKPRAARDGDANGYKAVRWCTPKEARSLGVSSATTALLALGKARHAR
jgi:A/G-specific adenine glycosylase